MFWLRLFIFIFLFGVPFAKAENTDLVLQDEAPLQQAHKPSQYIFHQQQSNQCYIIPGINYSRLQDLRQEKAKSGRALLDPSNFAYRMVDSIEINYPRFSSFFDVRDYLLRNVPDYKRYVDNLLDKQVVQGEFLDQSGLPFHEAVQNEMESAARLGLSPYGAIDDDDGGRPEVVVFTPKYYDTAEEVPLDTCTYQLGSRRYVVDRRLTGDTMLYNLGMFEEMLFSVGIGPKGEEIDDEHALYPAHKALADAMQEAGKQHPYADFKRENFFEYQLAQAFARNPVLKQKAMKAVDFHLTPWKYYQEAYCPSTDGGQPIPFAKREDMLCEDLVLAYSFSQMAKYTNLAAIGQDAYITALELQSMDEDDFEEDAASTNFLSTKTLLRKSEERIFSLDDEDTSAPKFSFLDVWQQAVAEMGAAKQQDYISFNGHGTVYVFNEPEFMDTQQWADERIARALGFTFIDSLYSNGLKPFYRRTSKTENVQQKPMVAAATSADI